ncbi:MAG: type II secretion system protein [Aquabacterium sp.]|jgi:MSHA biogenesis protein MshO|nr:MAG: type II secretion system protein [Aquabacterium sp.]
MRRTRPDRRLRTRAGFTLIELIIGLVVMGILAIVMVPLLRMPTQAYLEARGRTELQSQSDLLRGKLEADLAEALPGSLRVTQVGAVWYVEYLRMRGWGRLRTTNGAPGTCPPNPGGCGGVPGAGATEFRRQCATETCFTTVGDLQLVSSTSPPTTTDFVVIDPAIAGANVYATAGNTYRSRITSYTTPQVSPPVRQLNFLATSFAAYPYAAPTPTRFYVVSQPVSYVCNPTAGTLTRRWGYAIQTAQPTAFAGSVSSALLSNRISACNFPTAPTPLALQAGGIPSGSLLRGELILRQAIPGQPDEIQPIWLQIAVKEP